MLVLINNKLPTRINTMPTGPSDFFGTGFSITPSDATVFPSQPTAVGNPQITSAIWVGGAGNLAVTMVSGAALTLTAVAAGSLLLLRCTQVKATGTTATLLIGLAP